ncbi:MAG: RraA family protein [Bacteroidota bacterium]|nr:RraA family protein [Bacteroidota bacterium]MDP4229489.1 RraA family protein [Bacteroidota bacterium]
MLEDLKFLETLFTPLVSDAMDRLGIPGNVLDRSIQAIIPNSHLKVAGYAYPCKVVATTEYVEIDTILRMVDSIPENSIVLVTADHDIDAALWGGLMSTRAKRRGARGAVVSGGVRDIEQIDTLGFPVFGQYRCVKDIRRRGSMIEFGVGIRIAGVDVKPGDIVFGDANGVLIIPSEHSQKIIAELRHSVEGEQKTERGLQAGKTAQELFGEFKVF